MIQIKILRNHLTTINLTKLNMLDPTAKGKVRWKKKITFETVISIHNFLNTYTFFSEMWSVLRRARMKLD